MSAPGARPPIRLTPAELQALSRLWAAGWSTASISRLLDLRILVRRAPLGPECDGFTISHGLEFGRWLRERLLAEEMA